MREWIEPAEALRALLRMRHPEHSATADEITSYDWFWHWKSREVPVDVHQSADASLKELHRHIKEGRIRLRGELDSRGPSVNIDEIDCKLGHLYVFDVPMHKANELVIYREGEGFKIDRIYRRIHCSAEDLARIVDPAAPSAEQRQPSDAPRAQYKRDVARGAIKELWPDGVPDTVAPKELCSHVGAWLKAHGHTPISDDTILRAASRK